MTDPGEGIRPIPIRTTRIVDDITQYLRDLILDHKLPPGTTVLQTEWARRLGVSRTPLREALRLLEQDGLVRISNGNRTVEVVRYSADDLRDLYQLREMVDGLAARLLAVNGIPDALDRELADLLSTMDDAADPFRPSVWFPAHIAFHVRITEECGNPRLRPLLHVVRSTGLALHSPMADEGVPADELAKILNVGRTQHRAILDAIRDGSGAKAEAAARRHILSTLRSDLIRRSASGVEPAPRRA
ncbi:GntR family transcriptional regulator [Dactylosporangium sp. CA-092794]|uniref:GntR family transcriptional regulator n=1 Tax=Dactylosporangium sp. CA-092794 TaxID=3239929 RepID=UPI003D8A46F0